MCWIGADPICCLSLLCVKEQGKSHCASSPGVKGMGCEKETRAKSLTVDKKHASQSRGEERCGPLQTERLDCGFQCVLQPGAGRSRVASD